MNAAHIHDLMNLIDKLDEVSQEEGVFIIAGKIAAGDGTVLNIAWNDECEEYEVTTP